jgi:hypothetical protein
MELRAPASFDNQRSRSPDEFLLGIRSEPNFVHPATLLGLDAVVKSVQNITVFGLPVRSVCLHTPCARHHLLRAMTKASQAFARFKDSGLPTPIWRQRAARIEPSFSAKPTGWLCVENRTLPITEIDLLEIIPGRGLHIRTRQESWLISLPEELQSDELLRAITSGEVNCLSGSCEPFELSTESLKSSNSARERE